MRLTGRLDWRSSLVLGSILVISGLIGVTTAPVRVEGLSWKTYFLPVMMVVLGCMHLVRAWRRRAARGAP